MYLEERRRLLLEQVRRLGRVDVATAAAELDVTTETVRKDLVHLERQGFVTRTHGGAIPVQRLGFEPVNAVRESVMNPEKLRIAAAAVAELPEEGAVLIDSGTTAALVPRFMSTDSHLRVVTNSLHIMNALAAFPNITLMHLGGVFRPVSQSTVGPWAVDALRELRIDVAFVGANGFSVDHGLTTSDQSEAECKRAIVKASRRSIALLDHSKIGAEYFHRFASPADIDGIVTDSGIDADLLEDLQETIDHVVIA
ncbi:DeoR/GlpR family DNA-binding transcription regulator [Microbacterium sp.]|uniref:DeoR/GlpR family DNA-binding transcription regulator n=1 Tax=Microbacterium sp. TaxID=51671 RepID=UPI003A8359B9